MRSIITFTGLYLVLVVAIGPAAADRPQIQPKLSDPIHPPPTTRHPSPKSQVVPLPLQLPKPTFAGTPRRFRIPTEARLDPQERAQYPKGELVYTCTDPPPARLLVPQGTRLMSQGKPVRLSDDNPIIGEASMITDGEISAVDGCWVELPKGSQWIQIDLGAVIEVWAVAMWHEYADPRRVYCDVIVQIADDEAFTRNVRTVFNNDHDNSSRRGVGHDFEYLETERGKLTHAKGQKARYVRCYSSGSTSDTLNRWVEVAVFGKEPR